LLLWHAGDAVSHDAGIHGGTAKGWDMKNIMRYRLVRAGLAGGLALCLSGIAVNTTTASARSLPRQQMTYAFTDGTITTDGSVGVRATGTYSDGTRADIVMAGSVASGSGLGTSTAKVTDMALLATGTFTDGTFIIPFATGGSKQVITGTIDGVVPVSTSNGSLTNYRLKSISIKCTGSYPPLQFGCTVTIVFTP